VAPDSKPVDSGARTAIWWNKPQLLFQWNPRCIAPPDEGVARGRRNVDQSVKRADYEVVQITETKPVPKEEQEVVENVSRRVGVNPLKDVLPSLGAITVMTPA
jgi:hypothetical protein